jgi:hypothetical protein
MMTAMMFAFAAMCVSADDSSFAHTVTVSNYDASYVEKFPGPAEGSFALGDKAAYVYSTDKTSAEGGAVKIYAVPMTTTELSHDWSSFDSYGSVDSYGSDSYGSLDGEFFNSFTLKMVSYLNPGCEGPDCNAIPPLIPGGTGATPESLIGEMEVEPDGTTEAVVIALEQRYQVTESSKSEPNFGAAIAATLAVAAVALAVVTYRRRQTLDAPSLGLPLSAENSQYVGSVLDAV